MSEAELIETLKKAIVESGRTLTELAEATGVSQGQLSRFVHGQRTLTLETASKLFHFFGMRVHLPAKKPGKKK